VEQHIYSPTVVSISYHYKDPIKCVGLVESKHVIIISLNVTCSRHDMAENLLIWH